ncbi:MAG: hypothetical protein CMLOHMNK_02127 [Steroidobacteraceae bacterium]|nr:hypothetical protein [Steroidobacteraceae bacterium]
MPTKIPVIDLFAGPGGLGEGFSAFSRGADRHGFDVRLSIEMDSVAHRTLLLRKFFRSFDEPPDAYWEYVAGRLPQEELFSRYPTHFEAARGRAWQAELGRKNKGVVTRRIGQALRGASTWVLIGGPPCQAYSLVGRSRMQSRTNPGFESDHRHFLYREYLRIVARHRPPVFLMENVKGLLSATHGGQKIFHRILSDLHEPGRALKIDGRTTQLRYRLYPVGQTAQGSLIAGADFIPDPHSLVVRSEDFGIPQARHRVFVLGIREDLDVRAGLLQRSDTVHVEDVIDDLPRIRSTLSREQDSEEAWRDAIAEVRQQTWFRSPDSPELHGAAREATTALGSIACTRLDAGAPWQPWTARPRRLAPWYRRGCRGLSNHEARGHMRSDLHRYFFAACFARANGRSPTLEDFPPELMPDHRNVEQGRRGEMFGDRFRVQLAGHTSTTVTSHISKDGHYFIHYDPTQCRSLTVREAARLQTFPDSYHFEGPRTEQYHQVGNAVPPRLARQIAGIVYDVLEKAVKN